MGYQHPAIHQIQMIRLGDGRVVIPINEGGPASDGMAKPGNDGCHVAAEGPVNSSAHFNGIAIEND
jgi:hypothetical protein